MISKQTAAVLLQALQPLHLNPGYNRPPAEGLAFISDAKLRELGIQEASLDDHLDGGGLSSPFFFSDGKETNGDGVTGYVILRHRLQRYAQQWVDVVRAAKEAQNTMEKGG